ncbi:MAG: DUF805 domain-containing protein [Candidatus Omnitrophota bacterium]|nr:MAG: DUF805 domain-containing protein [Candidatus Omnitrophota bacterium]
MQNNRKILFLIVFLMGIFAFLLEGTTDDKIEQQKFPDIHVTGVIYDGEPVVIINGKVAKEGDSVDGVEVIEVSEEEVKLKYQGNIFVRKLGVKPARRLKRPSRIDSKKKFSFSKIFSRKSFTKKDFEKVVRKHFFEIMIFFGLIFIVSYVYVAITLQMIAVKTGIENGWLAWIPIANLYLQCEIADRPAWWLLLLFIPYLNIVIMVILWMDIAKARGRPGWLGMGILMPILNFILMGYLAFAKGADQNLEEQKAAESSIIETPPQKPFQTYTPPPEETPPSQEETPPGG